MSVLFIAISPVPRTAWCIVGTQIGFELCLLPRMLGNVVQHCLVQCYHWREQLEASATLGKSIPAKALRCEHIRMFKKQQVGGDCYTEQRDEMSQRNRLDQVSSGLGGQRKE